MHPSIRVDYDGVFVSRSIELSNQVAELRLVRDALTVKRQELSKKKLLLSLQRADETAVKRELFEVTVKWREVTDQIDALLEQQHCHLASCTIGYR